MPRLAKKCLDRVLPLAAGGRLDLLPDAARQWGEYDAKGRIFQAAAFAAEWVGA